MIDGVHVQPLRQIVDERGKIMHMLKATDPLFRGLFEKVVNDHVTAGIRFFPGSLRSFASVLIVT